MKIIVLAILLIGCGSVQTINGVNVKKPKQNVKNYSMVCIGSFGFLVWGMYNVKAIN
jgi:uncharacterized protein YceK